MIDLFFHNLDTKKSQIFKGHIFNVLSTTNFPVDFTPKLMEQILTKFVCESD